MNDLDHRERASTPDELADHLGIPRADVLTALRSFADRHVLVLEPDWRRKTASETEAVFRKVGLTGEFWRLRTA